MRVSMCKVVHVFVEQGIEMGCPSRIDVRLGTIGGEVRHVSVRGRATCALRRDLAVA